MLKNLIPLRDASWQPTMGQPVAKSPEKYGDGAISTHGGVRSPDMSTKENLKSSFRKRRQIVYIPRNNLWMSCYNSHLESYRVSQFDWCYFRIYLPEINFSFILLLPQAPNSPLLDSHKHLNSLHPG